MFKFNVVNKDAESLTEAIDISVEDFESAAQVWRDFQKEAFKMVEDSIARGETQTSTIDFYELFNKHFTTVEAREMALFQFIGTESEEIVQKVLRKGQDNPMAMLQALFSQNEDEDES